MAKESGKKSFLDFFKMKELDEDEFDDDLFDDDDDDDDEDDEYTSVRPTRNKKTGSKKPQTSYQGGYSQGSQSYNQGQYNNYQGRQQRTTTAPVQQNRVVEFSNPRPKSPNMNEVYVMIPHDSSESQTVTDFLKAGKTIVLNMSGLDTMTAQRIIDFVAGSTYALDGSLQAISDNIFIAAPSTIEVSGDLRQLLSDNSGAPNLYRY
ncbi:MAG: cell division protein SepF [Lachnospiraceae bacterium]|nr:cell division protein SepF [Lachnospiraceae bacterium]